jgi:predicted GIY-YIG superfamily endonuclease
MPRLTEQEQQEIIRFIEEDRPLPVKLLDVSKFMTKEDAYRLEYRIKKLPRNKKLPTLREG